MKMSRRPGWSLYLLTTLIVAGLTAALPARADIQFFTGIQGGNPGTDNVLYNGPNDILTGLAIQGHIDNGPQVVFTGAEPLLVPSGGQARIAASDGGFNSLLISLLGGGVFTKAIFNLDSSADGHVTITATEGNTDSVSRVFDLGGSGSNFFTAIAINGQDIKTIQISSTVDLVDIAQIRLGGGSVPVPEPSAIILLGISVLGVAVSQKSRWAKS